MALHKPADATRGAKRRAAGGRNLDIGPRMVQVGSLDAQALEAFGLAERAPLHGEVIRRVVDKAARKKHHRAVLLEEEPVLRTRDDTAARGDHATRARRGLRNAARLNGAETFLPQLLENLRDGHAGLYLHHFVGVDKLKAEHLGQKHARARLARTRHTDKAHDAQLGAHLRKDALLDVIGAIDTQKEIA